MWLAKQICGPPKAGRLGIVVDFSQPLAVDSQSDGGGGGDEAGTDEVYTFRVGGQWPVVINSPEDGKRRIVPMRWGFPDVKDWRRPRPIHAQAETIDQREAYREAYFPVQTGIVVFETFNEDEEADTKGGKPAPSAIGGAISGVRALDLGVSSKRYDLARRTFDSKKGAAG